ncbi:hypothetical protein L1987_86493 [Smallanthus sonchifolius]|uniref:Uncharacterized protein n=1 Tax=Smallanthus sonchifolius TaxID=185202 RepID=A0ACB8Y120_9ASTR|nr:hypothetical protein L1987_86493 [Smallanthus sonchifolius]
MESNNKEIEEGEESDLFHVRAKIYVANFEVIYSFEESRMLVRTLMENRKSTCVMNKEASFRFDSMQSPAQVSIASCAKVRNITFADLVLMHAKTIDLLSDPCDGMPPLEEISLTNVGSQSDSISMDSLAQSFQQNRERIDVPFNPGGFDPEKKLEYEFFSKTGSMIQVYLLI